jgi:hypothetical protein
MTTWDRPAIYTITHVVSGYIGFFYPIILLLSVFYHFLQYVLNVRFFIFELTYKEGNALEHTVIKLFEILYGFLIAYGITKFEKILITVR